MPASAFTRFNRAFLLSIAVLVTLGGLGLWVLERLGRLPSPPLTATNCIDEKFKFVRNNMPDDPRLIAVGSSVTWRNLDFSALDRDELSALRPINVAPCYLKIHETAFLTRFYLDNMERVNTVLSVFSMRDFEQCADDGAFFNAAAARRYVFDGWPSWYLYFKNFRPGSFLWDVRHIRDMRNGRDILRPLTMDRWGSGPLRITPPDIRNDVRPTDDCFEHLEAIEREMEARKVRWIVVLLPPMPAWIDAYDTNGERDQAWRDSVASHLNAPNTILIDGRERRPAQDYLFSDPAHLHWSSVPDFTRWIFQQVRQHGTSEAGPTGTA